MIVKPITSLGPYIITTFLSFLITFIISTNGFVTVDSKQDIIQDLPTDNDFDRYLTSLEKIVDFAIKHKIYLDINFEFGFFLSNVNLKSTLKSKRQSIPSKLRFRLEKMLMKTDVLGEYFRQMVQKTAANIAFERDRKISRLFANETEWPKTTQTFNIDLLNQTKVYTPEQLEKIYGKWANYEANVNDYQKYTPSPDESDICMVYLAENPINYNNLKTHTICRTPPQCKLTVDSGSEFGYGLTHRILFLVIAHHARGCSVFSDKEDKYKVDKYCMRTFNEAQYIASNYFKLADLMMEQISVCTLAGHAQFLRRSWLARLLRFQTYEGCFTENPVTRNDNEEPMYEGKSDKWTIASESQLIMGKRCNSHVSAVAAATLASTIRYIMEIYY